MKKLSCIFIVRIIDDALIFSYVLIQWTIKSLTSFVLGMTIRETFFRVIALLFEVMNWLTLWFITYKALFRTTCLKSIISVSKILLTIEWWFVSTILSISKILILDIVLILILQIDLLHWVVLLLNHFAIHEVSMQVIDQIRDVDWCVIQFVDQCEIISADSNDVFS